MYLNSLRSNPCDTSQSVTEINDEAHGVLFSLLSADVVLPPSNRVRSVCVSSENRGIRLVAAALAEDNHSVPGWMVSWGV